MSPLEQPIDDTPEDLDDILREARSSLRPKSAEPARLKLVEVPPSPEKRDPAAVSRPTKSPSNVNFEVDARRSEVKSVIGPVYRVTPLGAIAALLGLITVVTWTWVLTDRSPNQAVDTAYADASARRALAVTSGRIEAFRREFHRMPSALEEIGRPVSDLVTYEQMSADRYRLSIPTPNGTLTYDSLQPLRVFLGRTDETLGLSVQETRR